MSAFLSRRRSSSTASIGGPVHSPTGPYLDRGRFLRRSGWTRYSAVTAVGVAGFLGFLFASRFVPQWAEGLRLAALVWFIGCGVLRLTVFRRS
jgi:hypothetical protein